MKWPDRDQDRDRDRDQDPQVDHPVLAGLESQALGPRV
jgi:hypothetical protein